MSSKTATAEKTKVSGLRRERRMRLLILTAVLVLINFIGARYFFRLDLTAEKRYSLSPVTLNMASGLKDDLFIKVYLEGDFPSGFRKLQGSVRVLLERLRQESGGKISFEFVNPAQDGNDKSTNEAYDQLMRKGLQPTDLQIKEEGGLNRQVIWPGALLYYKGKEIAVNFLVNNSPGEDPLTAINASEELLEYAFANGIRKATAINNPKVLMLEGNRELPRRTIIDFVSSLSEFYEVQAYTLSKPEPIPADVKLVVVARPDSTFSDWARYKLDNFVMRGGRVLWLIDQVEASMDSMSGGVSFMAYPRNLNLDDMLFKYGVRLNYDLIQDIRCTPIPIVIGQMGNRPQTELMPWFYYPLVTPNGRHPLSKNLDPIQMRFAGTIDLIDNSVKKQVLLTSSRYTKVLPAPARVSLGIIKEKPNPRQFNKPNQNLAVLLEGQFPSLYQNRIIGSFAQQVIDSLKMPIKEKSVATKMIVVSDGDLIANGVNRSTGAVTPLGFDRYTGQLYGNKTFLLNCVDYLLDDAGFMEIRAREISLRLLNRQKVQRQKTMLQIVNVGVPLVLLAIFGFIFRWRRTHRFASIKL